jgi:DNA-binding NtrC family response regulator
VRPVGAKADRNTDFRLIAASNSSLHAEVAGKRFRADLMYRICGDVLAGPPLRARVADIEPLARHFGDRAGTRLGRVASFSTPAIRTLMEFEWPGNVRQLRTVVERAVIGSDDGEITSCDVVNVLERLAPRDAVPTILSEHAAELLSLLQRFAWDTVRVASELGISRKTVYSRIQKYDLHIPGKYTRRLVTGARARIREQSTADMQGLAMVSPADHGSVQRGAA